MKFADMILGGLAAFDRSGGRLARKPVLTVLAYHSVADGDSRFSLPVDEFYWQIELLAKTGKVVTLADVLWAYLKKDFFNQDVFLITFDDGYHDFIENALPVLKKFNLPATLFLAPGVFTHDNLHGLDSSLDVLTNSDVKKLGFDPLVDFGVHGYFHENLNEAESEQTFLDDCVKAADVLHDLTGRKIQALAYPGGIITPEVAPLLEKSNFKLAFKLGRRANQKNTGPFELGRFMIEKDDSRTKFRALLSGAAAYLRRMRACQKRL